MRREHGALIRFALAMLHPGGRSSPRLHSNGVTHLRQRIARTITLWALVLGAIALAMPAIAQTFPGIPFATPAPNQTTTSAPVVLDGQTLFSIAQGNAHDMLPVATRATEIESVLSQIVATSGSGTSAHTEYDPKSLRVLVERRGDENALEVVDRDHRDPLAIVTVTSTDAQAHDLSDDALAAQWQATLQGALEQALIARQPGAIEQHAIEAIAVAGILALLTLAGYFLVRSLTRRIDAISGRTDHHARLNFYRATRGAIVWGLLLGWFGAATFAALLFPQTTPLGHTIMHNGFAIAGIWIVATLADRLLAVTIARLPFVWSLSPFSSAADRSRQTLRVPTIVRAMNGFKTFVLVFLATLATMTQLGIPVGSVVTIGGVAAIAVSLAAQNLIRDFVSGFLVLAEDQFVVGDYVTINGASGSVERLTLRMVQIRDAAGSLVTISHSAATSVINHSRNWSRVDYAISIDPAADVDRAIELVRSTVGELEQDAAWREAFVDAIEWIGVDAFSKDGIVIRARIKTAPLQQFGLQRELNLRIVRAFGTAKIAFGAPLSS